MFDRVLLPVKGAAAASAISGARVESQAGQFRACTLQFSQPLIGMLSSLSCVAAIVGALAWGWMSRHSSWHSFCCLKMGEPSMNSLKGPLVARACWVVLRLASGGGSD